MWIVVAVVAAVVLVATYLTGVASRVDRLHGRVAATFSALDAQSVRRAAAAVATELPDVGKAARAVLGAHPDDREVAENDLTRTLREAGADLGPEAVAGLTEPSRRLALARQVHTDVVRDALAVRRRWLVRLLRLARRHTEPRFFDIDDPTLDELAPM
jgi:hypothetical protein